jgi:hypothetical protein
MLLLLAVSLSGTPAHSTSLRRIGDGANDPTIRATYRSVAGVLADRPSLRVSIPMLGPFCGPLLAEVIELQLTRRTHRAAPPQVHHPAAGQLAAMIFEIVQ